MARIIENSTSEDVKRSVLSNYAKRKTVLRPIQLKDFRETYEIRLPKEGGIFTYYKQDGKIYPYPAKGYPFGETVDRIDLVKKNLLGLVSGLTKMGRYRKMRMVVFALFFRKEIVSVIQSLLRSFDKQLLLHYLLPERYCQCVREVRRVKDLMRNRYAKTDQRRRMIKDSLQTISMVLEFDDAYRYRFQDVMGDFDRKLFKKNPISELIRIMALGESREIKDSRVSKTWKTAGLLLRAIRFYPPLKREIVFFFENLNIEEVKLSVEDSYHAIKKIDYNFNRE